MSTTTKSLRFLSKRQHSTRRTHAVSGNSATASVSMDRKATSSLRPKLLPLSRPLGVKESPTTVQTSYKEKLKVLFDHDAIMAERRHLIREAGKGYFHDINQLKYHKGKTWIAPISLIKEESSLYFPNISGKSIDDATKKDTTTMCFGHITLLAMLGTNLSEIHVNSFAQPTNEYYETHPYYQFVQINLQENLLKSMLVRIFVYNLRSKVPKNLQSNYLLSNQNMEYLRDPMGMTNSKVGYVYLLDENLKIRWAGCADAQLKEAMSLKTCTGVLLKRLEGKRLTPIDWTPPADVTFATHPVSETESS